MAWLKGSEIMLERYKIQWSVNLYMQLSTLVVHVIFTYGKHQNVQIHGIIIESQSKMG